MSLQQGKASVFWKNLQSAICVFCCVFSPYEVQSLVVFSLNLLNEAVFNKLWKILDKWGPPAIKESVVV